jgi:hypothetical protein
MPELTMLMLKVPLAELLTELLLPEVWATALMPDKPVVASEFAPVLEI